MNAQDRKTCCHDATCPACVRRQVKAERELRAMTEETRLRRFREMVAARQADGWQQ